MSEVYHYSPELLQLLVDTIEVLCRSKRDVILFFRGAGVHGQVIDDLAKQVSRDPDTIKKREIAQQLLVLVNEGGDTTLRQRREIVKHVVEWEDFSTCWDDKRLVAQGLVAQVRKRVNEHDAFTRMLVNRLKVRPKVSVDSLCVEPCVYLPLLSNSLEHWQ